MSSNPRSRSSRMRLSSHSTLRCCLAWVLCFCVWRGPVPVVHCHALETPESIVDEHSDWQLVQHIAVRHAGEHDHGHDSEWHLHFVLPSPAGSQSPDELPLGSPALAELITHSNESQIDLPVTSQSINVLADAVAPFSPQVSAPTAPKLIPLAPPRQRPSRVSPRIYYCVVQC